VASVLEQLKKTSAWQFAEESLVAYAIFLWCDGDIQSASIIPYWDLKEATDFFDTEFDLKNYKGIVCMDCAMLYDFERNRVRKGFNYAS